MPITRFPSLLQFNNIYARETWEGTDPRAVTRRGKVKLHGANMGIRIEPNGKVFPHAKTFDLTPQDDLYEFAAWVEPSKDLWQQAQRDDLPVTFRGEWAGPGTAKSVHGRDAVQDIPAKTFFIFAMDVGGWVITDPDAIAQRLPDLTHHQHVGEQMRVLPWATPLHEIDFADRDQVSRVLDAINSEVLHIEERDSYIAAEFGVEGPGEGIVYMPVVSQPFEMKLEEFAHSTWKAKGERHRVKKAARAASEKEPLPESALEFVETFVTEQRMHQGMEEACAGEADPKRTGALMKWMLGDIQKEGADEIAALAEQGVDWRRLQGEITPVVRGWYMARCQELPSLAPRA
jgi:hypothetical protein